MTVSIEQLRLMAQTRTATSITLGRFVSLLHHWAKKQCPGYNPIERKRQQGFPYLTDSESQAFLHWLCSLDKRFLQSTIYPPVCFRRSSHICNSSSPS